MRTIQFIYGDYIGGAKLCITRIKFIGTPGTYETTELYNLVRPYLSEPIKITRLSDPKTGDIILCCGLNQKNQIPFKLNHDLFGALANAHKDGLLVDGEVKLELYDAINDKHYTITGVTQDGDIETTGNISFPQVLEEVSAVSKPLTFGGIGNKLAFSAKQPPATQLASSASAAPAADGSGEEEKTENLSDDFELITLAEAQSDDNKVADNTEVKKDLRSSSPKPQ